MAGKAKILEIVISPDGSDVTIEGHGFNGKGCLTLGEKMQKTLAGVVKDVRKKPDYYKVSNVGQSLGTR